MRDYHDDPRLADLLSPERLQQLQQLLQQVTGQAVTVHEQPAAEAEPVEFNLETVAWLRCAGDDATQKGAARLLEFILYFVGKYRLAANLHRSTTEASFDELQRQNAALRESEERYRLLSEQLQQRVDEQVGVIESSQRQLYETARLRATGQLAAGMAHEINNPVGFISSNLRVAGDYLDELSELLPEQAAAAELLQDFRALLAESLSGAQRISAIVADLKVFSNIDRADFTPCNVNMLLTTACNLLQAGRAAPLPIELALADVPPLAGYPARLSQAFYNLLDNAAKALGESGKISVSSQRTTAGVEVCITDNGGGIAADLQERVFDPFFTTRGVGGGFGLGLTVAREIVVSHQGELLLHSRPGQGTRITLRFPLERK